MPENTSQDSIRLRLTARWIVAARAVENKREDRLFHDPWATVLAGGNGATWIDGLPVGKDNNENVIERT